jgi:hypothetical protein
MLSGSVANYGREGVDELCKNLTQGNKDLTPLPKNAVPDDTTDEKTILKKSMMNKF